jgi:hypothetical protein
MTFHKETEIYSALQLLEARKEDLDRLNRSTMRAHGKILGKDLFTWFDCDIDSLTNTLLSFPYPIIWIGKVEDVHGVLQLDPQVGAHLKLVIIYPLGKHPLPTTISKELEELNYTESLPHALDLVKDEKLGKSVLMITGNIKDWQENQNEIDTFIKVMKTGK